MGYVFISIAIYLASLIVAAYAMTAVLRIKYTIDISNLPLSPLLCLLCISALLTGIGLFGLRNRDILTKA